MFNRSEVIVLKDKQRDIVGKKHQFRSKTLVENEIK